MTDAATGKELPGLVREIAFESGASVRRGAVLVRLDTSVEETQLRAAVADAALAACSAIQRSVLTPLAMDLLDSAAARFVSPQELPPGNWILAVAYGGAEAVIVRVT